MKLRRLFALLMAALMLLGLIPAAQAQAIWCPDLGWEHAWSTPEYDYGPCEWGFRYCTRCGAGSEVPPQHKWVTQTIEQPDCTEPGWKESLCANCGDEKGDRQEIPALGHNWGSWRWVHGEPPCNSNGAWQVRDCQRCGQQEDRWIEGGSHAFGPWYSTQEPTCMAPGRKEHTCTRCGRTEWTTIPQLEHIFGEWRVIEEPQVGIPGTERRACTYHCGTHEDREIPPLTAETDTSLPQATKSIIGNPDNGEYYVPGEDIQFFLSLKNTCDQPIDHGFFIDPLFPDWSHDTLYIPQGDTVNTMLRYIVTEEDAARGYVENTFTAQLHVAGEYLTVTSNTVTALCGSADNAAVAPCLTVDMTYTNTPANGEFFTPGEVINYLITVTNTGDVPLANLQVGNSASEAVVPAPSEIAPGQTIQVPYYKLVYEENAKAGGIDSYGHANAFNGDPALPESLVSGRSADVFVPCGKGDGSPSVYYLKIVANAPANGLFFTEGETIKYRLSFGNNTKKDIYNITLNDPMANTRSVAFARRLKAGEFLMGEFEYVVTAADVAAGQIVNTGTSTWATKAEGAQTKTPSNTVVTPTGVDQPAELTPDALLEKYVKNTPANGEYFVPGETIEYAVVFMNVTDHELHDVEVYDPLKGSNEDITISREPIVEPNGTLYLSFNYVVTEEDAARGTVVNTASAIWLNPETEEWSSCDSNTVITDVGMPEGVSLIKTIENAPANGQFFVPGEVINFVMTVQNSMGKTLDVVVLTDPLSADFYHELLDIPVGAVDSRTLSYTVTELDAAIGSVTNCAYAVAYADGTPQPLTSNTVTAPCGFPDTDGNNQPDDPYGIYIGLDVTKSVESLPLNGSYYQLGETVAYRITYVNAGDIPLTDVTIYDTLSGLSEIASAEMLQPGESRSCFYNHTVTEADVHWGYISNTAIGQYVINDHLNSVSSNTVTVDTNGQEDIWIERPIFPGEDPEGVEPPTGSIDQDQLPAGDDYCKLIITARDDASVSYDTNFCAVHTPVQASVLAVHLSAAATPEMRLQADTYAVTLWRSAAEKLYEDIFAAADPIAKANVMTEYICFKAMVANYEAILKVLYPDHPDQVARLIAEIWEDKCVTLCYETHASAAERTDSLLSIDASAGAAATDCTCTVTAEPSGRKSATTAYCQLHAIPFSMTDTLLQGQDTREAWTSLRQLWTVELNKAYNLLCVKLGDKASLAMAECSVLTQWMAAREASLTALYPNNPELVAQTMVKIIMDRVNDLCPLVK